MGKYIFYIALICVLTCQISTTLAQEKKFSDLTGRYKRISWTGSQEFVHKYCPRYLVVIHYKEENKNQILSNFFNFTKENINSSKSNEHYIYTTKGYNSISIISKKINNQTGDLNKLLYDYAEISLSYNNDFSINELHLERSRSYTRYAYSISCNYNKLK